MTEEAVRGWYESLLKILTGRLIRKDHIFNMDETGTALEDCGNQRVVGSAASNRTLVTRPDEREWATSIECISATGRTIKPLLIFKGKHVQQQWFIPTDLPDWLYTSSPNAFTSNEIGLLWLKEVFVPETADCVGWKLLIMDGHKSHCTDEFMRVAWLNKIHCFYLIPHSSHIFQPLDLTVFSSLKRQFRTLVATHYQVGNLEPVKKNLFIQ